MLAGGTARGTTPSTWIARLDTGASAPVAVDLLDPRAEGASVTAFGDGALVAGGTDLGGTALATAEVYSNDTGGFDQKNLIQLIEPRTHHGAVVLSTGQTLLVDGIGAAHSLQIVDPTTAPPSVREEGLAALVARRDPTVQLLASGEILVAGGTDPTTGEAVAALEWLTPDASHLARTQTLAQGPGSAFIALEAGGALAVLTPPVPVPSGFVNVWVIDATGVVEPATTPLAAMPTAPALFGGASGEPILWTGTDWLRWDAYGGDFVLLNELDDHVDATARCSPDPGLALWLDSAAQPEQLVALRYDTSNAYSAVESPLLATDIGDTAPDSAPWAGGVHFDPASGMALGPQVGVFVTDRTYADVSVDLDAPTGQPAFVELRDSAGGALDVGSIDCPGAIVPGTPSTVHVERHGAQVTWTSGGRSGTCTLPAGNGRISVGVRGPSSPSVAKNLVVKRL